MASNSNKYQIISSLGLAAIGQEYKQLALGSVYWVGVSTRMEAVWVAGKTISSASSAVCLSLIADSHLDEILAYRPVDTNAGPKELRSYQLRAYLPDDMQRLPLQLDRAGASRAQLIILTLPIVQTQQWQLKAKEILLKWRNWVEKNNGIVLVVAHGDDALFLTNTLSSYSHFLSGVAFLQKKLSAKAEYRVWHWRNQLGVFGEAFFCLDEQGSRLISTGLALTQAVAFSYSTIYLQDTIVSPLALTERQGYELVASWDDLIKKGLTEPSPTLVFALQSPRDLEQLARTLYYLRQQRQQALRLVVLETGPQALRRSEIELLTLSGCSLVIPKVGLAHFFNLLEALHTQPDRFQLTDDVERALQATKARPIRGVLTVSDFVDYLGSLYQEYDDQRQRGSLVLLEPVAMLATQKLLAQIQMQRDGDVLCATTKKVYVFLYECDPALVNLALARLVRLPLSELVSEHKVVFLPEDVRQVLEKLQHEPVQKSALPNIKPSASIRRQIYKPVRRSICS